MQSIKKYNKIRTWKAYLKCWHTKCEALRTANCGAQHLRAPQCTLCTVSARRCVCEEARGKEATKRITIKWKTKGSQGKCEIHSVAAPPSSPLLFQPFHSLLQRMRKYENWVKICKCNEILFSLAKDTRQQQQQQEEDEQATSHMTSRIYLVTPGPPMPTWHSLRTPEIYA